ncbi:FMRFamide-activated amiloride-sensitive sodium channel-like [Limulus polyphemus]|uniref:FMRFamide-activated amiloride-sensitive sodium channel-like n=1 Tax=Limulus polyphemus TaxID=6850 RepID=A0ABM1S422_LIMPO|nr:FMRFamide-activated amiloride-sensitive sodium channel-like [Limulus polyphemus]
MNTLKVVLLINNKELMVYQHHPRYQDVELFSYIGGYLGIWLGISLANILDVIIQSAIKVKNWFINLKGQSSKAIEPIEQTVATIDVVEKITQVEDKMY